MAKTNPAPAVTGADLGTTARQLMKLAGDARLRPHVDPAPDEHGRISLVLNGEGPESMFGVIYVSARTGQVLCAYLTPGNSGRERRYDSVAGIRAVLKAQPRATAGYDG